MNDTVRTKRLARYAANTKLKERNLAFFDLEFTGFNLDNEILQVGCVVVSQPDLHIIREWQTLIKPRRIDTGDEQSLKVVEYNPDKWHDAPELSHALAEFNEIVRDAVLIGYNIAWDFFLLKKSFDEVDQKPLFHWQVLDVFSMAVVKLQNTELNGFRMREVVEHLGIENGHWHDALADARATLDIYRKLLSTTPALEP